MGTKNCGFPTVLSFRLISPGLIPSMSPQYCLNEDRSPRITYRKALIMTMNTDYEGYIFFPPGPMKLSTEILNKPIYNKDRKEFYLSQAEDYSPGDTDSRTT